MIPINMCEKCQGFMKVEKIGEDYLMLCPRCDCEKKDAEKRI